MQKRGQITVFIIIGILILGIISFFLVSQSSLVKKEAETGQQQAETGPFASQVEAYIQSCIETTGEDAVRFVSEHGGYYELPILADLKFYLPYYLYEKQNKMPSQWTIEQEISKYVNNELPFCLKNFDTFKEVGYDISTGEIETITTIKTDKVIFNIDFPVVMKKENKETVLRLFSAEIPIELGKFYEIIAEFMEMQENAPESICVSCLSNLASENNLRAEMYFVREGDMLFRLIDEKESNILYQYDFMNKYPLGDDK